MPNDEKLRTKIEITRHDQRGVVLASQINHVHDHDPTLSPALCRFDWTRHERSLNRVCPCEPRVEPTWEDDPTIRSGNGERTLREIVFVVHKGGCRG